MTWASLKGLFEPWLSLIFFLLEQTTRPNVPIFHPDNNEGHFCVSFSSVVFEGKVPPRVCMPPEVLELKLNITDWPLGPPVTGYGWPQYPGRIPPPREMSRSHPLILRQLIPYVMCDIPMCLLCKGASSAPV